MPDVIALRPAFLLPSLQLHPIACQCTAALWNTLDSLRVQFPASLTKQLSGDRREVQQGNAGVKTGIRAVGIGVGYLHEDDLMISYQKAVGLTVEIARCEGYGVKRLPEHIVVEAQHLVKPLLIAPGIYIDQFPDTLFWCKVLPLDGHIDR